MNEFQIASGLYIAPSPAGAFYAVSGTKMDVARRFLLALMAEAVSPQLNPEVVRRLCGMEEEESLRYLQYMQSMSLVQGFEEPRSMPAGSIEAEMPGLLAQLAGEGKALLADEQGFYLATHRFPHETAEELAGLAADLGSLYQRHKGLVHGNLSLQPSSWGVINSAGNNELGFWPLYVGSLRFSLVLTGLPRFNQSATLDLIWMLTNRYG